MGAAAAAAVLFAACAGTPRWIHSPPADTASEVYFTGIGSDPSGDVGKAEDRAVASMVAEITKYIGVKITADTTVEARATVESYEAEIVERIREQSSALVSDFRVVDRHLEKARDGSIDVYLLGAYDAAALAAEKERFARLLAERVEALSGPEREGDALRAEGELYLAVVRYLESASAALDSNVDNADVSFERVIKKATDAVSQIELEPAGGPELARKGEPFADPFVVEVSGRGGPIRGAALTVIWTERKASGRVGTVSDVVRTSSDGTAAFQHPTPGTSGFGSVLFSLSFASQLDGLQTASGRQRELINGFERAAAEKTAEFRFEIIAQSQSIPTAVLVACVLDDGSPYPTDAASEGVQRVLASAGFTVVPIRGGADLAMLDITPFLAAVRSRGLTAAERIAVGRAKLVDLRVEDGVYLARTECAISVTDVITEKVILTARATGIARGRSREDALEASFNLAGEQTGKELAAQLP
jgi:hypothetical protein